MENRQSSPDSALPAIKPEVPLIPPREKNSNRLFSVEAEAEENWLYVKSPREVHGSRGPHSIEELRYLYRMGEISDGTLVWTEGQSRWQMISAIPPLKYKLVTLPEIPSKKATELEINSSNPIPPAATEAIALAAQPLKDINKFSVSFACSRCGQPAEGHAMGHAEQNPDLIMLRKEIKFNIKHVGEIVPGFLWVGNHASARER
jgi:hypothetical protein